MGEGREGRDSGGGRMEEGTAVGGGVQSTTLPYMKRIGEVFLRFLITVFCN